MNISKKIIDLKIKFLLLNFNNLILSVGLMIFFFSSYDIPYTSGLSYLIILLFIIINFTVIKFSKAEIVIYSLLTVYLIFKLFYTANLIDTILNIKFFFYLLYFCKSLNLDIRIFLFQKLFFTFLFS